LKKSVKEKSIVELGMEDPNLPDLLDLIKAFKGVDTVTGRQGRFVIGFQGSPPWGAFLQYLQERGISVTSINTLQPTLEDAFVKITGLDREIMMMEKEGGKR
jgi:ABC-2 type transport system ATP-binding protein